MRALCGSDSVVSETSLNQAIGMPVETQVRFAITIQIKENR
jgi:hypothetical protein